MDLIRCSGDDGKCDRAVPREVAERPVASAPFIVRGFDLDYDGEPWLVYADRRGVNRVRCPEHRHSIL